MFSMHFEIFFPNHYISYHKNCLLSVHYENQILEIVIIISNYKIIFHMEKHIKTVYILFVLKQG